MCVYIACLFVNFDEHICTAGAQRSFVVCALVTSKLLFKARPRPIVSTDKLLRT
jgi:hypothetical protein